MNIQQIYELAVKLGIEHDLRGEARVRKILRKTKERYEKLTSDKKKEFDTEALHNPYSDSRVFVDHGREVKKVLVGIDIQPAEILIAKELGADLVIAHHPVGSALADLGDVMHLQAEVLAMYGVPINIAEALTKERISEVARGVSAVNHYRAVDAAKLFNMGLMCTHTVADNNVATFLDRLIKSKKPETVGEVIDALKTVPEYQAAIKQKSGPTIFVGKSENAAGRIVVTEITGGTEGAVGIYERMSHAGIGTIVCIAEGLPAHEMLRVYNYIRPHGVTMLGPNCPGALSPGKANVGIIPAEIFREGSIGLVSRSGTLTYQIGHELTQLGLGNSTIVGIGGDPIVGSSFIDILAKFEADPETEYVVMVGEIGGDEEEKAAAYIEQAMTKPVVAYIAGFTAPPGKTMGHAGAIISGSSGTAQGKKAALEARGIRVGTTPTEAAQLVAELARG